MNNSPFSNGPPLGFRFFFASLAVSPRNQSERRTTQLPLPLRRLVLFWLSALQANDETSAEARWGVEMVSVLSFFVWGRSVVFGWCFLCVCLFYLFYVCWSFGWYLAGVILLSFSSFWKKLLRYQARGKATFSQAFGLLNSQWLWCQSCFLAKVPPHVPLVAMGFRRLLNELLLSGTPRSEQHKLHRLIVQEIELPQRTSDTTECPNRT